MTGIPVTDLRITRALDMPTGIAGLDRFHTFQFVKDGFQTPETAAGQRGYFRLVTHKYLLKGTQQGHSTAVPLRAPNKFHYQITQPVQVLFLPPAWHA